MFLLVLDHPVSGDMYFLQNGVNNMSKLWQILAWPLVTNVNSK